MLHNPVLGRELLQQFRSSKTFAAILVLAAASAALVLLRWPSEPTADVLSIRSLEVFRPVAYGLSAAALLLVPAFPATSIVAERRDHTLALLLQSPLHPVKIYLGKFAANVILAVVLLVATVPAAVASYAMGGIDLWDQVAALYVVLAAMTLQYTAVALWVSARTTSADSSLRWSYAAVTGLALATLIPAFLWQAGTDWQQALAAALRAVSPLPALEQITGQSFTGVTTGTPDGRIVIFLYVSLAITLIAAVATIWELRTGASERGRKLRTVTEERGIATRIFRRLTFIVDPHRRKSGIPPLVNPLMVKEFRTRRFGRMHWILRLVATCAVLSMAFSVIAATGTLDWGVETIAAVLVLVQLVLLLVLGPSLASGLIAGELESGGWNLLRMTPLSPVRIVTGKVFSVLWTLLLILLATLPGYLVMMWIEPRVQPEVIRVLISLAITTAMVLSISMATSACNRRTAAATATNYIILLVLFAGTFLIWMARERPFSDAFVRFVLSINPVAAALTEIGVAGLDSYQLIPTAWWNGIIISIIACLTLAVRAWRLSRPE